MPLCSTKCFAQRSGISTMPREGRWASLRRSRFGREPERTAPCTEVARDEQRCRPNREDQATPTRRGRGRHRVLSGAVSSTGHQSSRPHRRSRQARQRNIVSGQGGPAPDEGRGHFGLALPRLLSKPAVHVRSSRRVRRAMPAERRFGQFRGPKVSPHGRRGRLPTSRGRHAPRPRVSRAR